MRLPALLLIFGVFASGCTAPVVGADLAAAESPADVSKEQWETSGYLRPHVFVCDIQPVGWCAGVVPFVTERVFEWSPNGTLTHLRIQVDWVPESPQTEALNVSIRDPEDRSLYLEARGAPPLVLEVGPVEISADSLQIMVAAAPLVDRPVDVVVEAMQEFELSLEATVRPEPLR